MRSQELESFKPDIQALSNAADVIGAVTDLALELDSDDAIVMGGSMEIVNLYLLEIKSAMSTGKSYAEAVEIASK